MSSEDFHKTAFSISYGHYEFDRMPFPIEKLDVKNDVKNDAKNNVKNDVKNYPNSWRRFLRHFLRKVFQSGLV